MGIIEKGYMIDEIAKDIHSANVEKGFWPEDKAQRNKSEVLMLIVSELSEAQEALRDHHFTALTPSEKLSLIDLSIKNPKEFKKVFEKEIKNTFEDEMIDALIRQLDAIQGFDIDLMFHLFMKLKYNSMRPYKHGKKF